VKFKINYQSFFPVKKILQIIKKPGDDGMSEQVYPYTVKYNWYTGAGKIGH
jgi:hypothetical protein